MSTFGGRKISPTTERGSTLATTAGSGGQIRVRSASTTIGRRIATVIGPGARRTAGRGLVTKHGDGRRITTVAGFTTTIIGRGVRAASSTDTGVGGARR